MRGLVLSFSLAVLLLAIAPEVGATPSTSVSIHTHLFITPLPPHGTFNATAPLCPSGTFSDEVKALGGAFTGVANTPLFTGTIVKHFVCADGTGTFQIQFHLHLQPGAAQSSGPWAVVGGTGRYSTLHGSGDFSVAFLPGKFLVEGFETFTGQVHFD